MAGQGEETGSMCKRDRVRRLLIEPLQDAGMRARRGEDPARHRAFLDRLCDDLAYLSDDDLGRLRRWAEINGEGKERRFWPPFVRFAAVAHVCRPRPIEELPEIARWFQSVAGIEAAGEPGRLVAEFRFIEAKRRPPMNPAEVARIAEEARWLAADAARARELRACGRMYDAAFLAAFEATEARATALVDAGAARRAEVAA